MYQGYYGFIAKKRQEVNRYELWRGVAKINNLSTKAQLRLEWMIFYETAGKRNATYTARYFSIARSVFYFWLKRFDETNLKTLEDSKSTPRNTRRWCPDPIVLERMIRLRKQYIHWSKMKLAVDNISMA